MILLTSSLTTVVLIEKLIIFPLYILEQAGQSMAHGLVSKPEQAVTVLQQIQNLKMFLKILKAI